MTQARTTRIGRRTIDDAVFRDFIARRAAVLLAHAQRLERMDMGGRILTRPLLGVLLNEASQIQELLDSYRARNNVRWHVLRHFVSSLKLFCDVGYKLLHISHSVGAYRLLPVDGDFDQATGEALLFSGNVILLISARLVREARELGIALPEPVGESCLHEELPGGYLPHDRKARHVTSAAETVASLATAFLNQAAESEILHLCDKLSPAECARKIPDPISEESLRTLQQQFHSLQSLYDTYVSDTDTEELDADLPVLRGHVSVIFHLLEIATHLAHYYERHIRHVATDDRRRSIVNPEALLEDLGLYALRYSGRFLDGARGLCQDMLKRYAEMGCVSLPVPRYRGFHVRPSTLISKIIRHYGSRVTMTLDQSVYDAISPLDLFRANEAINAEKRRRLSREICGTDLSFAEGPDRRESVSRIVQDLSARGKVVIYEKPLDLGDIPAESQDSLTQTAVDEIARLLAMGKLDIESEICVTFCGDRRVLADIRLLAEHGYGEDAFGNNIPLPPKLRYLRT